MRTIQKISALFVVSASLSMAGVIDIYTGGGKKPSTSLNLTTIDSLTFSGKAEKKEIDFSGKAKQKAIKLSKIDQVKFTLKDKSKETMTVMVDEGITTGKHKFKLSEIKKIEIVEMDANEDKDGDGLSDLEEIYKYDTNPRSADTDGDGWSDGEELADGMYSSKNPTKFNPRIADVPGLGITLKKSPSITLNITTSEGKSESETITEGREVSRTTSTSYEQTRSAEIMNAWEFSTSHSFTVKRDAESKFGGFSYTGSFTLGYNGSYTSSTGMTWGASEEKSVTESYENSIAKEKCEGSQIEGATLCMQVELKNTSDIAFTIEDLKLSASTFDIRDTSTLKILADLDREGGWSKTTLKPGETVEANFCNENVAVEKIENLIYNTSSIVLGSPSQTITFGKDNDDFTEAYTKVAAKTADITIDYGPGSTGNSSARYHVATNYRYNPDNKGSDDQYAQTSLAELLRNAHVDFEQDSVKGASKKKLYGLTSIDGYKFNLKDSAMWYVTIQRAADIKKGLSAMDLYAISHASYDLEEIFVGAGDAVHIFYSKDQDHDGVPLPTEHLFGTDDKKVDSDGDGLSDYDEITGWTKGKSKTKIYTDPTNEDTDGDGLNDKKDPEPTKRPMFEDASLSILQVFADSLMVDSTALLSKDSAALARTDSFDVFVQAPYAFINVVPNAKRVAWVKLITDETMQYVEPTEKSGKRVYSFRTPKFLSIMDTTRIQIEVKSEDEVNTKTFTLSITSALLPPTNLTLGKTADRENIIVNFDRPKDSRVKGFVILRAKKIGQHGVPENNQLPETIDNKKKIENGVTYDSFDVFAFSADSTRYVDNVTKGAPYYCYRVYAYTIEGDATNPVKVFSKGTEEKFRNVGRLHLEISFLDWGGEHNLEGGHRADIWSDVRLFDSDCGATPALFAWSVHDYMAGGDEAGNTVLFLSEKYDPGDDQKPDAGRKDLSIGKDGMCLEIHIESDYPKLNFTKKISWPYANMVNKDGSAWVYGTGRSGSAPKEGMNRFLIGQGKDINNLDANDGAKYDDTDGVCGDICGGDIHAGYKFDIRYYWDNDDDIY